MEISGTCSAIKRTHSIPNITHIGSSLNQIFDAQILHQSLPSEKQVTKEAAHCVMTL